MCGGRGGGGGANMLHGMRGRFVLWMFSSGYVVLGGKEDDTLRNAMQSFGDY